MVIGFHGCDSTVRRRVVAGTISLRPSENPYDWLGNGIYFWESNQQRALSFVKEIKLRKRNKSKLRTPAVVGAILDMGYCLDLLDEEYIELVKESYNILVTSYQSLELSIPFNRNTSNSTDLLFRNLDCAVIQNLHLHRQRNNLKPFDSVKGAFIEGKPLYPNAGFHDKTHIQVCVRNPNCIKGYFIPRTANDGWSVP